MAKSKPGPYAGLKYYTVLNSCLTERVDQIDSKTVNKQKLETYVVKNPKPSKSSKQGKPSAGEPRVNENLLTNEGLYEICNELKKVRENLNALNKVKTLFRP